MLDPKDPILLIEDDPVDALCVRRALKALSVPNPLVHFSSAEEGLEHLRNPIQTGRPCLILLDINMPRMNGIEFLRELRGTQEPAAAPVVVLTTSREMRDRCESFRLGIAGYMVKPVDFEQFVRLMRTVYEYWNCSETAGGCAL